MYRKQSRRTNPRFPIVPSILLIGMLGCLHVTSTPIRAQNSTTHDTPCQGSDPFIAGQGFTVKEIRIRPILKFMPSPSLQEALKASIAKQSPGDPGLTIGGPFTSTGVTFLESALGQELLARELSAQSGLIYPRHRLYNCDPGSHTLVVEYQVFVVARPSYENTNFELGENPDKEKKEAGNTKADENKLSPKPYIGYNRSRGVYAGGALSYQSGNGLINKLDLDASGSGSSATINVSLSGSHQFTSGLLSFAEWRLGYQYSNIPSQLLSLKDATILGQLFGATRALGSHNLFVRFGASVEGGHLQTNLAQANVPPSNLAQSRYRAVKMYVGGTLSGSRQESKVSYAFQLANSGEGMHVDYSKQLFDVAYRARFLPQDHRPLQIEAQFTAGILRSASGRIPVGERFFGGNVEDDFIQGDTWRIRSNPFIRSFPQKRLDRPGSGLPVGGESFVSFNLTVAPTVWNRQLMPQEIARDPDVTSGLGGQLLSTRLFLREETIQSSKQIQDLQQRIKVLTPTINALTGKLTNLQSAPLPGSVSLAIDKFLKPDPDADASLIQTTEDVVKAAEINPNASKTVLEDSAAVAGFLNNPVEFNARTLAQDDPANGVTSLLSLLLKNVSNLKDALIREGLAGRVEGLDKIATDLGSEQTSVLTGLTLVDKLRAYEKAEIEPMITIMNEPSPSSHRKMDEILTATREQLKPLRDSRHLELENLPRDSKDEAIRLRRLELIELLALLDAADTYAEKANDAFLSANDFGDQKQYGEAKPDLERLTIGFGGGIPSYLSGLAEATDSLKKPLFKNGQVQLWNRLHQNAVELLAMRGLVQSKFRKVHIPVAEADANQTVSYVGRVLNVFFRELNLVAITPVLMFDAARLSADRTPGKSNFRYGLGSGIRFSLVNLDLTAGYSINPHRQTGEGRGAFVFTMVINDLFR